MTDTSLEILGTQIPYERYAPFFPPFFPPSFCSCGWNGQNCTGDGSNCGCTRVYPNTCDGTTTYQYFDCGCSQTCPGTGGYNGALIDGSCGYVAPAPAPAGGGGGDPAPPPSGGGGGDPAPPPSGSACGACGGGSGSGCVDLKGNGEYGCL